MRVSPNSQQQEGRGQGRSPTSASATASSALHLHSCTCHTPNHLAFLLQPRHIAISRRGSLVEVNPLQKQEVLNVHSLIQACALTKLPVSALRAREEIDVCVHASAPANPQFHRGKLVIKELDLDSIRVLNSCLAQTVNLAFFESQVDAMYDTIETTNQQLEAAQSGSITAWAGGSLRAGTLYRHLGEVAAISNHVLLSGLRATVRPGNTAWKEERYSLLQEQLWEEFDLAERYDDLERKLTYVNDSIKYALEVIKSNKSINLERLIVLLISAELALSVYNLDMAAAAEVIKAAFQ